LKAEKQESKEKAKVFVKRTDFEGYFCNETVNCYLSDKPEYGEKNKAEETRLLQGLLTLKLNYRPSENVRYREALIFLNELMPTELFQKLKRDSNTKFQFTIIVQAAP
jgi:hypothetical protein